MLCSFDLIWTIITAAELRSTETSCDYRRVLIARSTHVFAMLRMFFTCRKSEKYVYHCIKISGIDDTTVMAHAQWTIYGFSLQFSYRPNVILQCIGYRSPKWRSHSQLLILHCKISINCLNFSVGHSQMLQTNVCSWPIFAWHDKWMFIRLFTKSPLVVTTCVPKECISSRDNGIYKIKGTHHD